VRSAAGSLFNKRVNEWEDRLFLKVPRADDNDNRYDAIRAKHFISIEPDPIKVYSIPNESIPDTKPITEIIEKPIVEDIKITQPIEKNKKEKKQKKKIEKQTEVSNKIDKKLNTQFTQGSMVKNDAEVFMDPGGTFTFGDDK
jgi:hypothetical protein